MSETSQKSELINVLRYREAALDVIRVKKQMLHQIMHASSVALNRYHALLKMKEASRQSSFYANSNISASYTDVAFETVVRFHKWRELQYESDRLFTEIKKLEEEADSILGEVDPFLLAILKDAGQ